MAPSSPPLSLPSLRSLLSTFPSSPSPLRILSTHPPPSSPPHASLPPTLYVLDSSFNPPTLAHHAIAVSALSSRHPSGGSKSKRLLLLLATQNADKPPKPAAFEHRIMMMAKLADGLVDRFTAGDGKGEEDYVGEGRNAGAGGLVVDVGITKHPYYSDKALAISQSEVYNSGNGTTTGVQEQIHLLGFDSLVRLLDTKYYAPHHTLEGLGEFFSISKAMVRLRGGAEGSNGQWGSIEEQRRWIDSLGGKGGMLEQRGGKAEWVDRIEVEEADEKVEAVSSTKVREAVKKGDWGVLSDLVLTDVAMYVKNEGLYQENG